jgi:hypothetical protein
MHGRLLRVRLVEIPHKGVCKPSCKPTRNFRHRIVHLRSAFGDEAPYAGIAIFSRLKIDIEHLPLWAREPCRDSYHSSRAFNKTSIPVTAWCRPGLCRPFQRCLV